MSKILPYLYSSKYLLGFTIPISLYISFTGEGWLCWFPIIFAFGIIPLLELILPETKNNEPILTKGIIYDIYIVLLATANVVALFYYFQWSKHIQEFSSDYLGKTISMGISSGAIGINLAHEFGHRKEKIWKVFSHFLLMTNHYLHFYLEHNFGHHKLAATNEDPATARLGESVYAFWIRCIPQSFISAIKISKKMNISKTWYQNRMINYMIVQIVFDIIIFYFFGVWTLFSFILISLVGILLLETVNYVEHYGLTRQISSNGKYEPFREAHAWNSDHFLGRSILFELTRHTDHHLNTTKPYQKLISIDQAPQLPIGYPAAMVMSLFPGIWKKITHPIIEKLKK